MCNFTPKTATEALRFVKTAERAQAILDAGYKFIEDAEMDTVYVMKPGDFHYSYLIDTLRGTCDCPDFQQRGTYCKHTVAWEETKREEATLIAQGEESSRWWREAGYASQPQYC